MYQDYKSITFVKKTFQNNEQKHLTLRCLRTKDYREKKVIKKMLNIGLCYGTGSGIFTLDFSASMVYLLCRTKP